jgi:hypothetical protein
MTKPYTPNSSGDKKALRTTADARPIPCRKKVLRKYDAAP